MGHLAQLTYALLAIPAAAQEHGAFVGPATCNATSCHGATRPDRAPASASRIAQDEYTTWFLRDPHRQAFEALSSSLGSAMGRRLGIDAPRAAECLACHAMPGAPAHESGGPQRESEPGSPRLAEFGVSCEACHGAASGWYGAHFQQGFDRKAGVASLGLVDLLDPRRLAQQCVGCHLGDATRVVDHRLIAAGHPELRFEAGSHLQRVPRHWRDRGDDGKAWRQRTALVGQAVALKAQLERVAREAAATTTAARPAMLGGLDLASFDCASCHHDLRRDDWEMLRDFRLSRGRPTPVGRPLFDGARFVTARAVAAAAGPELAERMKAALAGLEEAAGNPAMKPEDLRVLATATAAVCDDVEQALAGLDPAATKTAVAATLAALARDAELVAAQGIEGARQASGLLLLLREDAAATIERELIAPFPGAAGFLPQVFAARLASLAREP